jgi:hypothetical protein
MHEEEEAKSTSHWTPSLNVVRAVVEGRAGHSFNWAKLRCYRDGKGDTFLQSETCLDIAENSFLAIFSLGQQRDLELLPKRDVAGASLAPQRISLRHNSLLLLGPQTSRMFLNLYATMTTAVGKWSWHQVQHQNQGYTSHFVEWQPCMCPMENTLHYMMVYSLFRESLLVCHRTIPYAYHR